MKDSIFKFPILPTELITGILSRLPVKALLQFKCVSKSWLALISSPEFIKTHLSVSANNKDHTHHRLVLSGVDAFYNLKDCSLRSLLSSDSLTEAFDLDYPMKNPTPQENVLVVGSINGLICLAIGGTDLFLWNPSIRKFNKLSDARPIGTPVCSKYGFGYDESHHDYKVVLVMFYDCTYVSLDSVKVKIYSLNSDYCRTVVGDFQGGMRSTQAGKFANGKLHWATNDDDWNIISIDLADGKWGKVEQSCYGEGYSLLRLAELRSDLSVCCNYMSSHTDVWVMKEYGVKESWIKMYTIKYLSDLENPYFSRLLPPTLCMPKKGEILLVIGSTLMIHNPEDESTRYTKVAEVRTCFATNIYNESLVWPLLQNEPSTQQE